MGPDAKAWDGGKQSTILGLLSDDSVRIVVDEEDYDFSWITRGLFYLLSWLNVNPTCISNYIHHKVWDEITYPFPNIKGCTVEVWIWIINFVPHFNLRNVVLFIIINTTCKTCHLQTCKWIRKQTRHASDFNMHQFELWMISNRQYSTYLAIRHDLWDPRGR